MSEKRVTNKIISILILTLASSLGFSMEEFSHTSSSNSYSFSGPCSSQGVWTRSALTHTNELKQVLSKMKDNPACQSLKANIMNSFTQVESSLNEVDKFNNLTDGQSRRIQQLPQEISALRTFTRENSAFKGSVINLLLGKTITYTALSSRKADGAHHDPNLLADSISRLAVRSSQAATTGLQLFNSTFSAFQQAESDCLDDNQGLIGASVMASMTKILASFAGAGENGVRSTQLANTISNLGQYLSRDKKYIVALRKLNDREFINSMSCLLEVTSQNYCSNLDGQYLFKEIMDSQKVTKKKIFNNKTGKEEIKISGFNQNFEKNLSDGPLAGYYILSRQVPIVTNWLQKVQYGITPQLPTEADFQIGVSTNVYQHYNTLKQIEGTFNFQKKLLAELKDFKSQQTYVLEMLNSVANNMINSGGIQGTGRSENFFAKVSTSNEIYFRLIGIPVPQAVLGQGDLNEINFTNNPNGWLQAKYRDLPIFSSPVKLAETITINMQQIFSEATSMAIAYYNKYFIVDKVQVVNDSLLGIDSNVRDALINIDKYLENLALKVKNNSSDKTMYASIIDTRIKISGVLSHYKKIRDYSLSLIKMAENNPKQTDINEAELNQKVRKLGDDLLQKVYLEFEVLTARTGWLTNRMTSFVYQDYTISLRKRDQFDPYFEDLMLATGYNTLNQMMNMAETGYSEIKTDLDSSMNINKKNIESLENVIRGVYVRNIFDLMLISKNKEMTDIERQKYIYTFSEKIYKSQLPGEESNAFQRYIRSKLNAAWSDLTNQDANNFGGMGFWDKLTAPFKLGINSLSGMRGNIVVSPVSSFKTAEGEMAKLCVQTLAFANLRPYWALCVDSILKSPMAKDNMQDPDIKEILDNYLSIQYKQKAYEHIEPSKKSTPEYSLTRNYESRICALRDYHRRNEIARITSAMRQDGDKYENSFTDEVENSIVDVENKNQPAADQSNSEQKLLQSSQSEIQETKETQEIRAIKENSEPDDNSEKNSLFYYFE